MRPFVERRHEHFFVLDTDPRPRFAGRGFMKLPLGRYQAKATIGVLTD